MSIAEFAENPDLYYAEVGKKFVAIVASKKLDSLDFAAKAKASKPKCQKGFSCGSSCISKSRKCKNAVNGQAATYLDWLKQTISSGGALSKDHVADATAAGLMGGNAPTTQPATPAATTTAATKKAAPLKPTVSTNQKELKAARSDLEQRFGRQVVEDAEKNVKKILADSDIYIRAGSTDTLEKILGDRFRTAHELGVTNHQIPLLKDKNYLDARARVEEKTLGVSKNTKDGDRPIYGYIGGSDMSGNAHSDVSDAYGSIAIKLKPEVKDRATFTGSDSFKSGIASPINNPNAASLVGLTRHGYDRSNLPNHYPDYYSNDSADGAHLRAAAKAKSIDDLVPKLAVTGKAYMEAQVHGGVTPKDIAEIHFSPTGINDRPSAAIAQFAKDNGVDLYVNGKKQSAKDLDNIINPPKKTQAQVINDALDNALSTGDFHEVVKHVKDIDDRAKKVKLAGGEADAHLKVLYELAGYDGKPKVGTEQDVTNVWQSGGALMVRGVAKDDNDPTKYLKQFQTGDYFVGNGIYGNGTYVGHAGAIKNGRFIGYDAKTAKADAKRAFADVAKHNYINKNSITFRMALDPSANVGIQSDLETERDNIAVKLSKWQIAEEQKIRASAKTVSPADVRKYNTALTKITKANSALASAAPVEESKKVINGGVSTQIIYSVTDGTQTLKFEVVKSTSLFSGKGDYGYIDVDGRYQKAKNQKDAIAQAHKAAIADKIQKETLARTGFASPPVKGAVDTATQKKIDDLSENVYKTFAVLGISNSDPNRYGKGNSADQGALGRFGVIRGYDAIALNHSYEPDTFMNLLNRSKVTIQQDPLDYKRAMKTGAF